MLRASLARGADVNIHQGFALRRAARHNQTAAVQFLLDHGADVNAAGIDGRAGHTALHEAAYGHPEVMAVLLAAGANVHARTDDGLTPLAYTLDRRSNIKCCALLLAAGADVDDCGEGDYTPLYCAIEEGRRDIVKMLLRAGAKEIAAADLPSRIPVTYEKPHSLADDLLVPGLDAAFETVDAIHAAGGWAEYVKAHRRVLSSLVSKLAPQKPRKGPRPVRQSYYHVPAARPSSVACLIPPDAASHVVAFWCPPGGY